MLDRRQYQCIDCGRYFKEDNPFSFEKKSTSIFTENMIVEDLRSMTATYKSVAQKYLYNAVICVDPFLVIENLSTCLQNIRWRIMSEYAS